MSESALLSGQVVILNGGSSAGKTSLAHELQDLMPMPTLVMGIDLFWFTLPRRDWDPQTVNPQTFRWKVENIDGLDYFQIEPGPVLDRLMRGRYEAIHRFARLGFHVVADDVVWKREWLEDALEVFGDLTVYFIAVVCSDEEGSRREIERGDRCAGWHRGSAMFAHRHCQYDHTVDTTDRDPASCAANVKAFLDRTPTPKAFSRMRERYRPDLLEQ
jgi:chloramphenicol 3-O phosphotransferase